MRIVALNAMVALNAKEVLNAMVTFIRQIVALKAMVVFNAMMKAVDTGTAPKSSPTVLSTQNLRTRSSVVWHVWNVHQTN